MKLRLSRQIILDVSKAFNVPLDRMLSDGRDQALCRARWAAMKLIRDERYKSLPEIARLVHRADHTTVINGIRQANHLIANDPGFAAAYERARAL